MKNLTFFDRLNLWIANSISVKLFSIGVLILIMLIPMSNIQSLINEREYRRDEVQQDISNLWGKEQEITGLIMNLPYHHHYKIVNKDGEEEIKSRIQIAHILPETLNYDGTISPEIRYRSIYEMVVYQSDFRITGHFNKPDLSDWGVEEDDILWEDAFVSIGIPDMRGIGEMIHLNWNREPLQFEPGTGVRDLLQSGVHCRIPMDKECRKYDFALNLELNGSGRISFIPMGKETKVKLSSTWADPSFIGAFSPKREISKDGFTAEWKVVDLNRNFPQKWTGKTYNFSEFGFGVNLFLPVDQYQRSTRATKYAILFIALTFLVFFFLEVIHKLRIHPFQYILVGLGLCLFYTLLISLSEHISFNIAYLVASSAIVFMIFLYSFSVFRKNVLSFMMFGLVSVLYTFLFVIIQEQDFSLLIGSVALFFILSLVMYISRNVNWYGSAKPSAELNLETHE